MIDPISPNSRESIGAIDVIDGSFFYAKGTSVTGAINVNAMSAQAGDWNVTVENSRINLLPDNSRRDGQIKH